MSDLGGVGQRRPRAGIRDRVRGTTGHVGDELMVRAAHVAVHRSTRPHALVSAVDVEEATAHEGVLAVVTGADLYARLGERLLTGPAFNDQPALAVDRVRYVGEPVAAVVARDAVTARAAADQVVVEYEDLEPVDGLHAALHAGTYVHERLRPSAHFGDLAHLRGVRDTNVNYEFSLRVGDVGNVPAGPATHTVSGEFWAPPTHHVPIELPCTVAWVAAGRLEVLTTTQTPSYVRQAMADMLGLPLHRVRVRTRPLGGSFGSKMYDRLEPLAAALAWILGTAVRFTATREEAFLLTTRHGAEVTGSLTADQDGGLLAATADVVYDTGAYADVGPRIAAKSGMLATGPYRVPNVRIRSRCVYTNKPSAGPFRGFGVPQVTWSHECLIDDLARALGQDPYRFRRRHLLREGDEAATGTRMHSADFVECLDAVADAVAWGQELDRGDGRRRRGRGIGVGAKAVLTPTVSNAVLQFNQDGSASLMTSTVEMGQGSDTIMAQLVGEVLQIGSDRVHVVAPDTDVTPYDTITAGSRSTYHMGNAVQAAAERMRGRLVGIAASHTGASVEQLKLTPEGIRVDPTGETVPLTDLVREHFGASGATMTTEAEFVTDWTPYDPETGRSPRVTEHWFAGAVAAQVVVDTATGGVEIEHLAVAGDVGRAINPTLAEQQLVGGALMGVGHALFDELVIEDGQLVNGTLLDYQIPSLRDVPRRLTPLLVETPHRAGPFGAKGVGETGILAVAPAIGNAVRDAVGVRVTRLPITPERLLDALTGGEA